MESNSGYVGAINPQARHRRRWLIALSCLVGGVGWPLAVANALVVGIAGCEGPPLCGETALLFAGLYVSSIVAMALAIAGMILETRAAGSDPGGLVALAALSFAAFLGLAAAILDSGQLLGLAILLTLAGNVVYGVSVNIRRRYSAGAGVTLVAASVGHVVGLGVLVFPLAWVWLGISAAKGPRPGAVGDEAVVGARLRSLVKDRRSWFVAVVVTAFVVIAVVVVRPAPSQACDATPTAMPGGYGLAYTPDTRSLDANPTMCVVSQAAVITSLDPGTPGRNVTPHDQGSRAISPDGRFIAFASDHDYQWHDNIYVQPASSGEPIRLTAVAPNPPLGVRATPVPGDECSPPGFLQGTQVDSQPTWSPDGLYLAFVRNMAKTDSPEVIYVVCVMRADGSELRLVARKAINPSWTSSRP